VPELIQGQWRADRLAEITTGILDDDGAGQRTALALVRRRLGPPGASKRAAEAVVEHGRMIEEEAART
jgi:hypothetical protein